METTATANGVDTDLARLFDAHAAKLLRYCACRVGRDTAEDLVAQVFLVAASGGAVYDPTRAASSPGCTASPLAWCVATAERSRGAWRGTRGPPNRMRSPSSPTRRTITPG
jgi:hypothetical protein